jgi:inner membrane transporter RhtA
MSRNLPSIRHGVTAGPAGTFIWMPTPPPQVYFIVSAVFHYLGPAFAVLLFARVDALGVAWLRIATAAAVFALWRRPWRGFARLDRSGRRVVAAWGAVLAAMNCCFYLAIEALPLATVAAIEFLPVIALAALGARTRRNAAALVLAVPGVYLVTGVQFAGETLGVALALANALLFAAYIVLAHRVSRMGALQGVDGLAASMLIAAVVVTPVGAAQVLPVLGEPVLLLAGLGVGLSSSVIPYVADQLAMRRLPRASYALLVAILPATAAIIGAVVLGQVPSPAEAAGIALVIAGVAVHRAPDAEEEQTAEEEPAPGPPMATGAVRPSASAEDRDRRGEAVQERLAADRADLARGEEARRGSAAEGVADGERIVVGVAEHPAAATVAGEDERAGRRAARRAPAAAGRGRRVGRGGRRRRRGRAGGRPARDARTPRPRRCRPRDPRR